MVFAGGLATRAALLFGEVEVREASPRARMHSSTQQCTPGCFPFPTLARDYMREERTWVSSRCKGE
jgi:hypothetical protein